MVSPRTPPVAASHVRLAGQSLSILYHPRTHISVRKSYKQKRRTLAAKLSTLLRKEYSVLCIECKAT